MKTWKPVTKADELMINNMGMFVYEVCISN